MSEWKGHRKLRLYGWVIGVQTPGDSVFPCGSLERPLCSGHGEWLLFLWFSLHCPTCVPWLRFIPATWVLTSLPISTLLNPKHTKRAPFLPPRCPLPAAWIQCSLPPHSARGRGSAHGRGNRTSWGGGGSLDFECSPLFLVWKYLGFV